MCSNVFKRCSNMCKCFPMCSNVLKTCSNVLVLAVTSGYGRVLGGNGFFGGNGCFLVVTSDLPKRASAVFDIFDIVSLL